MEGRTNMEEEIMGVIDGCEGGYPMKKWSLFVTSNRIIAARLAGVGLTLAFGIAGRVATSRIAKRKSEEMKELSPEEVLLAHKKNFDIPYSGIHAAHMKKPGFASGGKLQILTSTKKHKFLMTNKKSFQEHADLLQSVLGGKLALR